jgi:pimeloyl-ACP methyl ester carboxylesterase
MWATRNAIPVAGKFPLVVYAPSFSSVPWENADLCEYLASFGYVVVATPAMGVHVESTHDVVGTNAQARDISFLIGFASTLANVDTSKIAVIGYSWGGLANVFAAARDSRITALVGLDGSTRSFPGVVKGAGDVHPEQMHIPFIYFRGQHTDEDQAHLESQFSDAAGPNVLNEWTHGDLFTVSMLGLVHPEFSSKAQRNEELWTREFATLQEADYDRQDGVIGYSWVARYTRAFLGTYLKQDSSAKEFMERPPIENGVPKHTMAVRFRAAKN